MKKFIEADALIKACIEHLTVEYLDILNSLKGNTEHVTYNFTAIRGRRYFKIVKTNIVGGKASDRSVHSFVDCNTGAVYKPAGWAAPAKGVRYTLTDMDRIRERADPYGSYLYR